MRLAGKVAAITREEDVERLVDRATAEFGRPDVMYNNAGIIGAPGPRSRTPPR